MQFRPHKASEIFPLLDGEEFAALVQDIKEHGQREPIVVFDDQILDGRNRYRACQELGIEPSLRPFMDDDPQAFVISMNLHRRHLNESQRAMIAAKIANAVSGDRNDLVEISTKSTTAKKAGDMLNVNRASVFNAKTVINEGTPEEIEAVETGQVAVSTAAKAIKRRKAEIEKRSAAAKAGGSSGRVVLPDGMSATALAEMCATARKSGKSVEAIARQYKFHVTTASRLADIHDLMTRDDLGPRDRALASDAMDHWKKTQQVGAAWQIIEPVARRLWGKGRGTTRSGLEARRLEDFWAAYGVIIQSCRNAALVDVPQVPREQIDRINEDMAEAKKALNVFHTRIKEIYA